MQQNSPEWHELRARSIGGSDAPVIMGVSPWKTPYQLWQEKLGLYVQAESPAMTAGKQMEEQIRLDFEKANNLNVYPKVLFHPKHKWVIASMDGVTLDGRVAVELKMANKKDHAEAQSGKVPDKYYPQLQHQMFVGGWKSMYYFSWHQGDGKTIIVERNNSYIENLFTEEEKFYRCVIDFVPPPLNDRDIITQDSEEWRLYAGEYLKACELKNQVEETLQNLKDKLITLSGGSSCRGGGLSVTKTIRKGQIDYQSIPDLHNINLDNYRKKPTEVWTIRKDNADV